jgi:hypothetical protein
MQIVTNNSKSNYLIGQRYEVLSNFSQTGPLQSLVPNTLNIEIKIFVRPLSGDELANKLHDNTRLLVKCLTLISMLFTTSTEGLQEASETLESIVEYYKENTSDSQQIPLPQNLEVITASVLPSVVRQPLILDFE